MPRYYHVVGTTQYLGTCKMHLFEDCHQLQKTRISHRAWGDSDSTGDITECDYETGFAPHKICKICTKRKAAEAAK